MKNKNNQQIPTPAGESISIACVRRTKKTKQTRITGAGRGQKGHQAGCGHGCNYPSYQAHFELALPLLGWHNGVLTRECYSARPWHVLHCSVSALAINYSLSILPNYCQGILRLTKKQDASEITNKLQKALEVETLEFNGSMLVVNTHNAPKLEI